MAPRKKYRCIKRGCKRRADRPGYCSQCRARIWYRNYKGPPPQPSVPPAYRQAHIDRIEHLRKFHEENEEKSA